MLMQHIGVGYFGYYRATAYAITCSLLRLGIHFSSEDVKNPCHFECPHRLSDKLLKSSCDAF